MKFHIIGSGKIKEKYLTAGIDEFLKRLKPYGQVQITEIGEERMPDNPSAAEKKTDSRQRRRTVAEKCTSRFISFCS